MSHNNNIILPSMRRLKIDVKQKNNENRIIEIGNITSISYMRVKFAYLEFHFDYVCWFFFWYSL